MSMSEVHEYFYFNQIRERYADKGVTLTLTASTRDDMYPDNAWFVAVMPDGGGAPVYSQWLHYPEDMDISDVWDEVKDMDGFVPGLGDSATEVSDG